MSLFSTGLGRGCQKTFMVLPLTPPSRHSFLAGAVLGELSLG